jgi:hypothetical protein
MFTEADICQAQLLAAAPPRWPKFPTPFTTGDYDDGGGADPLTEKEQVMVRLSNAIRRKQSWWCKVHDDEISEKWRNEAVASQPHHVDEDAWSYFLNELKWHSSQISAADDIRVSPVDGVFESDDLIPKELCEDLIEGVAKLEVSLPPSLTHSLTLCPFAGQ